MATSARSSTALLNAALIFSSLDETLFARMFIGCGAVLREILEFSLQSFLRFEQNDKAGSGNAARFPADPNPSSTERQRVPCSDAVPLGHVREQGPASSVGLGRKILVAFHKFFSATSGCTSCKVKTVLSKPWIWIEPNGCPSCLLGDLPILPM